VGVIKRPEEAKEGAHALKKHANFHSDHFLAPICAGDARCGGAGLLMTRGSGNRRGYGTKESLDSSHHITKLCHVRLECTVWWPFDVLEVDI
jgi:hypothetical protein